MGYGNTTSAHKTPTFPSGDLLGVAMQAYDQFVARLRVNHRGESVVDKGILRRPSLSCQCPVDNGPLAGPVPIDMLEREKADLLFHVSARNGPLAGPVPTDM